MPARNDPSAIRCRKGHVYDKEALCFRKRGRCRLCERDACRRRRIKKVNKYIVVEPESEYLPADKVPEHKTIVALGYWIRIAERAMLLDEGEAIRVSLDEVMMTGAAVREQGSKGEFTLKLTVKPTKFAGIEVAEVEIDPDIKIKKPEEQPGTATFFVAKDGRLMKEDPRQADMFAEDEPRRERTQ